MVLLGSLLRNISFWVGKFCMLTGGYLTFESATLLFFLGDFCQFFLPLSCQKYQAKEGGLAPAECEHSAIQRKSQKGFFFGDGRNEFGASMVLEVLPTNTYHTYHVKFPVYWKYTF